MQEDWFQNAVKEKWTEMKKDDVLKNCILEEKKMLKEYDKDLNKVEEWATACSEDLLSWIESRIYWLNDQWLIK